MADAAVSSPRLLIHQQPRQATKVDCRDGDDAGTPGPAPEAAAQDHLAGWRCV